MRAVRSVISFFKHLGRLFGLACKKFYTDNCFVYTSSLTYYCILAVVPTFAMCFAIAKGFGMESYLKNYVASMYGGQEKLVWTEIISFSNNLLARTKSGIIAGAGILILLWTAWSMLNNIETAFNNIWKLKNERSLVRKISDYMSMIFLFPVLLLLSLGTNFYIASNVQQFFQSNINTYWAQGINTIFSIVIITMLYIIMPNKRIRLGDALYGGCVAGLLFQCFQWLYVHYQVKLAAYNAIYGSFAALPLFILWISYSWMIIFVGLQMIVVQANYKASQYFRSDFTLSWHQKQLLSLCFLRVIIHSFQKECAQPVTLLSLCRMFNLPLKTTEDILSLLEEVQLIDKVTSEQSALSGAKTEVYKPFYDVHQMDIGSVLGKLSRCSSASASLPRMDMIEKMEKMLHNYEERFKKGESNISLIALE